MRDKFLTDAYYAGPARAGRKAKHKEKLRLGRSRFGWENDLRQMSAGFQCAHCRNTVFTDSLLSGVLNRNHCPYCLWSRHLDLHTSGDRLAACKATMQPVGLSLKKVHKRYAQGGAGELMLVHQCIECGAVSVNRIAADDDSQKIIEVFEASFELDTRSKIRLQAKSITLLEATQLSIVRDQLYGRYCPDGTERRLEV
jgi:hypothetical protein